MKGRNSCRLRPFLYKFIRRPVRGGHDHHAFGEQALEQPPQDHRVGDVGDLHFVEAQQPRLLGDLPGGLGDELILARSRLRARLAQARVRGQHEFVEVRRGASSSPARLRRTDPSAWTCRAPPVPRGRARAGPRPCPAKPPASSAPAPAPARPAARRRQPDRRQAQAPRPGARDKLPVIERTRD